MFVDQDVSQEEVKKPSKGRKRSTSKGSRGSNKTKKDKMEKDATETQKESKSKTTKCSRRSKEKPGDKDVSKDSVTIVEAETSSHKPDAVEEDLGMSEVDLSTLTKGQSNDKNENTCINKTAAESTISSADNNAVQKVIVHTADVHAADCRTDKDVDILNDSNASGVDIFQTPNEYNKSIGFNMSDPDQHVEQSISSESDKSKVSTKKKSGDTRGSVAEGGKKASQKCEAKDEKKSIKKKITRKKIKREIGPLTIAAKKAELTKANESVVSECNNSNQDSESLTPAANFKKVPSYIAPTPSPASSFSSASMTPKHVRMLDFGMIQTPPGLPGQSPPISNIGAQVTLGFRSPVYAQLGTPGSVHSHGGNTPNGSECGGFMSPAYHPSPASCGPPTPNSTTNGNLQDTVPVFLADHVFGQFGNSVEAAVDQIQIASDAQNYETPAKPSCAPEESSEASRFAAKLSKVDSPNIIRALANTIGIPTDDSANNSQANSDVGDVIQSPPELPNFGRSQTGVQIQNRENLNTVAGNPGTKVAAEVNTPVTVQLGQSTASVNNTDQFEGDSSITVPDGAQNEDSSSSSVASSVLMPPPTMTPRRNMYKTPKKQMIRTGQSVSPIKSPGLKSLIEDAKFINVNELSQSPRTSQKNLDIMDDFINSSYSGSPAFKLNTPQKFAPDFKFETPVKDNSPLKLPLVKTPGKVVDAFVSQFTTPQKNEAPEAPLVETPVKGVDALISQFTTPQKNEAPGPEKIVETLTEKDTSANNVDMQTEPVSVEQLNNKDNVNVSCDGIKKKKKKSKDRDRDKEKKGKKKSKSKKKDKDKDQEAADGFEKEKKHSGKKSKHKRSKSKKEKTEAQLEAQKCMLQTPLGSRSPLVCGMTLSQFDANSNSKSPEATGDIELLMSQIQSQSPAKSSQVGGQVPCISTVVCESSPGTESTTLCVVDPRVDESGSMNRKAENVTICSKSLTEGDTNSNTSSGSKQMLAERKPLAEKSTTSEKGEVKRGKKRRRHREDKKETTPEKKKQVN